MLRCSRIHLIRIRGHLLRDKCMAAAAVAMLAARNEIYVKDNCHIATMSVKFFGRQLRKNLHCLMRRCFPRTDKLVMAIPSIST